MTTSSSKIPAAGQLTEEDGLTLELEHREIDERVLDSEVGSHWRRFRFSLRTLLILVSVCCVWLGYGLHWMRQRHELLARYDALFQTTSDAGPTLQGQERHLGYLKKRYGTKSVWPPLLLLPFGEPGVVRINAAVRSDDPRHDSDAPYQEARGLFPEALEIIVYPVEPERSQ